MQQSILLVIKSTITFHIPTFPVLAETYTVLCFQSLIQPKPQSWIYGEENFIHFSTEAALESPSPAVSVTTPLTMLFTDNCYNK